MEQNCSEIGEPEDIDNQMAMIIGLTEAATMGDDLLPRYGRGRAFDDVVTVLKHGEPE